MKYEIRKGLIVNAGGAAGVSHNITQLSKDLDDFGVHYPEWIHEKAVSDYLNQLGTVNAEALCW